MKVTTYAVKRRIATSVIAIALVVLGIYGFASASGEFSSGHDLPHDQGPRLVARRDSR